MIFEEDRFLPTIANDIDTGVKTKLEDMLSLDLGYGTIPRQLLTEKGRIKVDKLSVYASGDIGSNIRDAISGRYYKSKVGSQDEDYFFKVRITNGLFKTKGGSTTLFFESPGIFQKFMNFKETDRYGECQVLNPWIVKDSIKQKWEKRNHQFLDKMDVDENVSDVIIVK
jgi:hypothetical protein